MICTVYVDLKKIKNRNTDQAIRAAKSKVINVGSQNTGRKRSHFGKLNHTSLIVCLWGKDGWNSET